MIIPKREQLEYVNSIKIGDGQRKTLNCPFCGGVKKFTLSHQDGKLIWNCFKASCTAKGAYRVGHSLEAIKTGSYKVITNIKRSRDIPEILSDPAHHNRVMAYLEANNCLYAYNNKINKISYDPKEDRVLFHTNGVGAVGRSLSKRIPKWLTYGNTDGLFISGHSDIVVLVEDAASACAVAATGIYTGAALLGTNVSPLQRAELRQYKTVYIALDKDASSVAIKLYKKLSLPDVRIVFLQTDLKYLDKSQVLDCLKPIN